MGADCSRKVIENLESIAAQAGIYSTPLRGCVLTAGATRPAPARPAEGLIVIGRRARTSVAVGTLRRPSGMAAGNHWLAESSTASTLSS
jgi:hypothetical protein